MLGTVTVTVSNYGKESFKSCLQVKVFELVVITNPLNVLSRTNQANTCKGWIPFLFLYEIREDLLFGVNPLTLNTWINYFKYLLPIWQCFRFRRGFTHFSSHTFSFLVQFRKVLIILYYMRVIIGELKS